MAGPDPNAPPADPLSRVWITLVTRASYLPGAILLIHTLYKHHSAHPIIVQYTATLPADCLSAFQALTRTYPLLRLQHVEPIALPTGLVPVATRFDDTLTKLRAFAPPSPAELRALGLPAVPAQACFLDADMIVLRNMDDIFDIPRPAADWIAAHHACVCNIDFDPWAPPEWNRENCPSTPLVHPSALNCPVPCGADQRPTYQLLNSGVFVFTPSAELWGAHRGVSADGRARQGLYVPGPELPGRVLSRQVGSDRVAVQCVEDGPLLARVGVAGRGGAGDALHCG